MHLPPLSATSYGCISVADSSPHLHFRAFLHQAWVTVPNVVIVANVMTVGNNIPALCNCGNDGGNYGFVKMINYFCNDMHIRYSTIETTSEQHIRDSASKRLSVSVPVVSRQLTGTPSANCLLASYKMDMGCLLDDSKL